MADNGFAGLANTLETIVRRLQPTHDGKLKVKIQNFGTVQPHDRAPNPRYSITERHRGKLWFVPYTVTDTLVEVEPFDTQGSRILVATFYSIETAKQGEELLREYAEHSERDYLSRSQQKKPDLPLRIF